MSKMVSALVCLCILVFPIYDSFASLDTATISYESSFSDGSLNIWYTGGSLTGVGGIYTFNKTQSSGLGNLLPDGSFQGLCVELSQWASSSSNVYNIAVNTNYYIAELWDRYFDQASQNAQKAEAFSAAMWEIVYESNPDDWDVGGWNETEETGFKCTGLASGMSDLANNWLDSIDGTQTDSELVILTNDSHQDYIATISESIIIPEPITFSTLAMGSIFLILRKK